MKEMVGGCCVCSDERGWDENPLVYCDGPTCSVAVHQACYGIVTVPSGPWFCRKCESQERSARVRCDLCPSKEGAFKRTDSNGWAHVVCALYIPEVRFGNVTTMEPIQVSLIPQERYTKSCYVCEENNRESKKNFGAFMQCNKAGCKMNFHVTCAQFLGLLCEEAGNMMDNVKYCGYCQYHYSKLKKTSNMKIIPPFKPIPSTGGATDSPTSSPEKNNPKGPNDTNTSGDSQTTSSGNGTAVIGNSGPSSNMSPDLNNGNRNSGNSRGPKKSLASSKSGNPNGNNNGSNNSGSPSPIPRIQQASLFSSGAFSSSLNSKTPSPSPVIEESGKLDKLKAKGPGSVKSLDEDANNGSNSMDGAVGSGSVIMKPETKPLAAATSGSASCLPAPFVIKNKDFATVSMNDVVTAALDRPMSSIASKFGRGGPSNSGQESSNMNSSGSTSSSRCDKPPPDIKPHVTLTPIPMRSDESKPDDGRSSKSAASASLNFSSTFGSIGKLRLSPEVNRELKSGLEELSSLKTSPVGKRVRQPEMYDSDTESATEDWPDRNEESRSNSQTLRSTHFSRIETYQSNQQHTHSNNTRMLSPAQAHEMSQWEANANSGRLATVAVERIRLGDGENSNSNLPGRSNNFPAGPDFQSKRGPGRPAKARGGASRDEEPRERKPTPAKRGRRGSASNLSNYGRREARGETVTSAPSSNGVAVDEPSFEDPSETASNASSSGRGGRHAGLGRKPIPSTSTTTTSVSKKPNYDEIPTPTLSQLKAQMASSAPAAASTPEKSSTSTLPPHMFGNVLNPASSMAQRLVDNLSQEIEMANAGGCSSEVTSPPTPIVGIPFPGKSSVASKTLVAATNGLSAKSGSTGQPQTLEELLERQWEQGSQFLMEQAQHLDIAQLLSCLNQLKQDNKALEDHVASLCQRKEQLTAINARLTIPLGSTASLSIVSQGFNATGGTPPLAIQGSKSSIVPPPPVPHTQLQQQIQQETVLQQGRLLNHSFQPGMEMPGHSHGQGHHGHGHGHSSHSHRNSGGSSTSQVYGYPGHGSGGHGSGSSAQVSTSHPSPHMTNNTHQSPHLSNNSHHSSHPPRDPR